MSLNDQSGLNEDTTIGKAYYRFYSLIYDSASLASIR